MKSIEESRKILRAPDWAELAKLETEQEKGVPPPPVAKPAPAEAKLIDLPKPDTAKASERALPDVMAARRTSRAFAEGPISLEQLSFLLWATGGLTEVKEAGATVLGVVPSGGGRHPFDTYVYAGAVEGLEKGMWRYLPLEGKLALAYADESLGEKMTKACLGQQWIGDSAATLIWAAVPARMEWRYEVSAHRIMLMEAGCKAQNCYLSAEALGMACCVVGTYSQHAMDTLIGVDTKEEMTALLAAVGRPTA